MKKKLAYVDYWSHKNTRSGDFLREILSEKFEITNFWWKENDIIALDKLDEFEYIFFFHVMFPYQTMKRLKNKKIMWAPMYDALNFRNNFFKSIFWKQISYLGIKILAFSKKISESIENENVKYLKLNYYIKPSNKKKETNFTNKINIFFWDRGRIKFEDWLKFFKRDDIGEITYFPKFDPNIIDKNKINYRDKYSDLKINLIQEKFLPKEKYLELSSDCNVFIAPRKKEGIGIALVEAISRGQYIVGFNDATMNEYINDDKIGFLFDSKNQNKIKLQNIIDNYKFRLENANSRYMEWNENKKKILDFFEEKNELVRKFHFIPLFLIDNLKYNLKKIFKINFYY